MTATESANDVAVEMICVEEGRGQAWTVCGWVGLIRGVGALVGTDAGIELKEGEPSHGRGF